MIPFYNEEEIIQTSINVFSQKLESLKFKEAISDDSFLVFIDDGGIDASFDILQSCINLNNIIVLKLSKNVGHQNVLLAWLQYIVNKCDCATSIDCDLEARYR